MTESPTVAAALAPVDAVILDLDGVVTDTAELRAAAWKQLFDEVLQDPRLPAGTRRDPFTAGDYRDQMAGRTWEGAVVAFLGSRGGAIPDGSPADGSGAWTAFGLAARQSELFEKLLSSNPVRAFPGTADLLGRLKAGRIPVVLATSARNAGALLGAAGLESVFDHVIDGQTALDRDVGGKPAPALPLEAVRRLEIPPARAMVIEDSAAGVEAGRRGGFGLVVGIDRDGRREALEAAGADVVVEDLSQLDIGLVITHPGCWSTGASTRRTNATAKLSPPWATTTWPRGGRPLSTAPGKCTTRAATRAAQFRRSADHPRCPRFRAPAAGRAQPRGLSRPLPGPDARRALGARPPEGVGSSRGRCPGAGAGGYPAGVAPGRAGTRVPAPGRLTRRSRPAA